ASYQQAIDRCSELQKSHPDHTGLAVVEIDAYLRLAEMHEYLWHDDQAGHARSEAYASFQQLNLQHAADVLRAADWSTVLSRLAGGLVKAGRKDEARIIA